MKKILSFQEWLEEELTTTSNVAITDKPLGKLARRKKLPGDKNVTTNRDSKVQPRATIPEKAG